MALLSSRYIYEGTETTETSITRVGSLLDPTGSLQSRKIVTTANSQWLRPFKAEPYVAWNGVTNTNVTATVYGVVNNGVLPLNDELWMDVEYLTYIPAAAVGDPYWSNVKLLLGFEGANASTGVPGMNDEGSVARGTATVVGNAAISTAQFKFGTSSLALDGNGDYVTFPDSADWDFGTGPFTIEGFFRFAATPLNTILVAQWSAGFAFWFTGGVLGFRPGSGSDTTGYTFSPTLNQWYHLAVDRDAASVARIYIDGVMVAKTTSYTVNITGSSAPLTIGSLLPGFTGYDINGWVDEIRISNIARYGSDAGYTVPTARFPRVVGESAGTFGKTVTTTKANVLAAGAAVTSDSSSWNTATLLDSASAALTTVSASGLVAASTSGASNECGARCSSGSERSSGKFYFEATVTTVIGGNGNGVGVCPIANTFADMNGTAVNGVTIHITSGSILHAGSAGGSTALGAISAGGVIGIAIDLDNRMAWYRIAPSGNWNGTGTPNPATNTGGVSFPSGAMAPVVHFGGGSSAAGNVTTVNFGASSFIGTVPSGFTAGWPSTWSPFKLTTTINFNPTAVMATWDTATATAVTLSGGNLVATNTGTTSADQGARVATALGQTAGKYYFEVTYTTATAAGGNQGFGVGTTASTYTNMGNSATSGAMVYSGSGNIWSNGSNTGITLSTFTAPVLVGIAVDLDNRKIWFKKISPLAGYWNNNASYDPATNVGGVTVPAGTMVPFMVFGAAPGAANNVFTANFGATAFSGAVPSGFTSGWATSAGTFYPPMAGYIEARVRAAKASTTYYIDPQIVLSPGGATAGATTSYATSRYAYEGTETTETAITRVNGAADPLGNKQSRKIVTTANSQWLRPFKAEPYAQWSSTIGNDVSVTVCGTVNSSALPLNDEIWMDVEYLSSSAPLGKIVTTTKANVLASGTSVTSDSSTWNGTQYANFDGINSTSYLNITNYNLSALVTSGPGANAVGVRSLSVLSTGKYYFEVTCTAAPGGINVCILGSTATYVDVNNGFNSSSVFYQGDIYTNDGFSGKNIGTFVQGDVICCAFDLTARRCWLRRNNGNWNATVGADPATNTGGLIIEAALSFSPAVMFNNVSTVGTTKITANFGMTSYVQTPPSGFGNWPGAWQPFKLTTTLSAPQLGAAGYIHVRPRVAKASSTFYIDPQITLLELKANRWVLGSSRAGIDSTVIVEGHTGKTQII